MRASDRPSCVEGISEALATLRAIRCAPRSPRWPWPPRSATTAVVQTGLDGLAARRARASARAFGSDTFVLARVAAGTLSRREFAEKLERNPNITRSDVRFLDGVAGGRVRLRRHGAAVGRRERRWPHVRERHRQRHAGVAARHSRHRRRRGRFFTEDEDVRGAQVVVPGRSVADELFPGRDPLGQAVRIGGRASASSACRRARARRAAFARSLRLDADHRVRARLWRAGHAAGVRRPERATSGDGAEDHARVSMRARRHLGPGAADTFDIITPEASRTLRRRASPNASARPARRSP